MKRFAIIAVALLMISAGAGSAVAEEEKSIAFFDCTLSMATEPAGGFGKTAGFRVGESVDVTDSMKLSDEKVKVHIRGDLAYYEWDDTQFGFDVSYKRIIFFGGGRYFIPMSGRGGVAPYLEGGLELSYDDVETASPVGTVIVTDIRLGLAGGAGLEIPLADDLVLGFNGRLRIIADSFLTLGVSLGVKF